MGYHVEKTLASQHDMSQGLTAFTEQIANKAEQWGDNFATIIQRTQLARELGKDIRTINRYLTQLSATGLVEISSKRGRKGGTVIVFNNDKLRFTPTDNPITSETKEAQEIRERVFPTVPKKEPKRRYRTKAQIAEDRALRQAMQNENERLNDIAENRFKVTRDFFDNFTEPDLYFKGYLCAQIYNAYAVIFPENRYNLYKDSDQRIAQSALRAKSRAQCYDVLPNRFVGTPQFAKFVEMARFCLEQEINPLSYLTVQFEYAEWLALAGHARVGAIPYVNSLMSEQAKDRYFNREHFYNVMRAKYGLFKQNSEKTAYIGARFPIISGIYHAWRCGKRTKESLDSIIEEPMKSLAHSGKQVALYGFYSSVLEKIKKSDLSPEKATALRDFLREQVALYSGRHTLSIEQYLMAFPLQIYTVRTTILLEKLDMKYYYAGVGNMNKLTTATDKEFAGFIERGKCIDFSYRANDLFPAVLNTLADYRGLGVDLNLVRSAMQELGEDIIPLDRFGMLDVHRLYDSVISKEEMADIKEQEVENLSYYNYA